MWYLCIIWLKFSFNMTWRIQLCRRGLTTCRATSAREGGGGVTTHESPPGQVELRGGGGRGLTAQPPSKAETCRFRVGFGGLCAVTPTPFRFVRIALARAAKSFAKPDKIEGRERWFFFFFFFWWGGKKRRCNFTHALSFMSKYFYSCTFFFRDCKVVLLFGTLIRSTYYIYRCLDFLWEDIY